MSDPVIPPGEEQYWRYNPEFLNKYVENKGRVDLAELTNREPPGPFLVQTIDSFIGLAPSDVQNKWAKLRPYVMEPGDPVKLRAAADAWCPEGRSGGTGSLYGQVGQWKREIHDAMYGLRKRWTDSASDGLDSYLRNRVDVSCLDPMAECCEKIADALRAKAAAVEAWQKQIDRTQASLVVETVVGSAATAVSALPSGGITTAVAAGIAASAAASAVLTLYAMWLILEDFSEDSRAAMDRLGVDIKKLGNPGGTWPRPWSS